MPFLMGKRRYINAFPHSAAAIAVAPWGRSRGERGRVVFWRPFLKGRLIYGVR